jgi:hypothetical protein
MEPSSEHEREIARRIDALASKDRLTSPAIAEIVIAIPFPMSESETQFLIDYLIWREDHPINQ